MNAFRTYGLATLFLGVLLFGAAPHVLAQHDADEAHAPAAHGEEAAAHSDGDPNAIGHSADGYYMDFSPAGIVELPRLLLVRRPGGSLGFDAFASTHSALESGDYILQTVEGVALTRAQVEATLADPHHPYLYFKLVPAQGEVVVDFSLTRQLVWVFIVALLTLWIGLSLAGRYKKGVGRETAPKGVFQNMMEALIVFIREDIAKPSIGDRYRKYMPYLVTVFIFIVLGNLLGLVPWGVTATSNIMVTGTLAAFTFFITQFAGTKDYWKHIFWPPDVPVPIKFILIPVEVLGMFTKPLALAFRLFGNMVSGHLVIVSILGLIFIFAAQLGTAAGWGMMVISVPLTLFIYVLKIVVSLVQAYIFTMLSAVFIGMAVIDHHHDEPHMAVTPEPAEESHVLGSSFDEIIHGTGDGVTKPSPATQPSLAG